MTVLRFEPTPNPNALKVILAAPLSYPPASFLNPDAARDHPLASALFSIPGVTCLLLSSTWLTVNKSPEAPWGPIKKAVERTLASLA